MIKMVKGWIVVFLIGFLVFSGAFLAQAAQDDTMTNAQFVSILVDVLGLEMPTDADILSEAEFFEVQANMLAERGITLFVDAQPNVLVTKGGVADVLYDVLIGPSDATTQDKIGYLVDLGYINTGGADDVMSFADVTVALNVPALSTAIAEAYSPPPGRKGKPGPPPPGRKGRSPKAGPPPEGPASRI